MNIIDIPFLVKFFFLFGKHLDFVGVNCDGALWVTNKENQNPKTSPVTVFDCNFHKLPKIG